MYDIKGIEHEIIYTVVKAIEKNDSYGKFWRLNCIHKKNTYSSHLRKSAGKTAEASVPTFFRVLQLKFINRLKIVEKNTI